MSQKTLKQSQKNEIFQAITDYKLSPFNFSLVENETLRGAITKIAYKNSNFYYKITLPEIGGFYTEYSPGNDYSTEKFSSGDWNSLYVNFREWLGFMTREINEPDLWEKVNKFQLPEDIKLTADQNNSRFNYSEMMQIKAGLGNLKEYFQTQLLLEKDQIEYISKNIDYLVESSKNQGRQTFYYLLIGNLVTIITALSIGPTHGKAIWGIVRSMFLGLVNALSK